MHRQGTGAACGKLQRLGQSLVRPAQQDSCGRQAEYKFGVPAGAEELGQTRRVADFSSY